MLPFPNRATLSVTDLYNYDETLFDNLTLPTEFDTTANRATLINQICMRAKDFEALYPDAVFMKYQIKYWSDANIFVWNKIYSLTKLEYNPIENYDRMEESSETGRNATERTGEAVSARAGSTNQNQTENRAESRIETGIFNQNQTENRAESSSETGTNNQNQTENRAESSSETGSDDTITKKAGYNTTTLDTQSGQTGSSSAQKAATAENTTTGSGSSSAQKAATAENTTTGTGSSSAQRAATTENTTTGTGTTTETATGRTNENENSNHNILKTSRIHGNIGVTTPAQMLRGDLEIYPDLNLIHRIVEDFVTEFCIMVY